MHTRTIRRGGRRGECSRGIPTRARLLFVRTRARASLSDRSRPAPSGGKCQPELIVDSQWHSCFTSWCASEQQQMHPVCSHPTTPQAGSPIPLSSLGRFVLMMEPLLALAVCHYCSEASDPRGR